jgi:broad specificity phosphatase PhoE
MHLSTYRTLTKELPTPTSAQIASFYFIRHAESAATAGLSTEHPSSNPLTETGKIHAEDLAGTLDFAPAIIATSTYLRTQLTAEPLQARFPEARRITLPMIREFTYLAPAAWQHSTASQRLPAVDDYWQRSDPVPVCCAFAASLTRHR